MEITQKFRVLVALTEVDRCCDMMVFTILSWVPVILKLYHTHILPPLNFLFLLIATVVRQKLPLLTLCLEPFKNESDIYCTQWVK